MDHRHLLTRAEGGALKVTLHRPEVHNAFDEALISELTDCFAVAGADPAIRAVVLEGAGASFCAGADLAWMERMAGFSSEENLEDARRLQRLFAAIHQCPKVTIARVHGAAIGGGAGLVAVCDIAVAAPDAHFALSEVRLGLVPAVIAPYVLERIGIGRARPLFVTGERIDAAEALRIGLVDGVSPLSELDAAVESRLALIRESGPGAIATAKRLLRQIAGRMPAECAEDTAACIAALRASPEGQEGIQAFLQKRKPRFES